MNRLTRKGPWNVDFDIGRNLFLADSIFNGMSDFFSDVKFPKYNVFRAGNDMEIEIALAGYNKDDIEIELSPDNVLKVSSRGVEEDKVVEDEDELGYYVHRGIAARKFEIAWKVGVTHEVGGISLVDGMLHIPLKSKKPTDKPATKILKIK